MNHRTPPLKLVLTALAVTLLLLALWLLKDLTPNPSIGTSPQPTTQEAP
jgi:hypothetical protein